MVNYQKIFCICALVLCLPLSWQVQADAHGESGHSLQAAAGEQDKIYGKVIETLNAGSYTYVRVDDGEQEYWAASPSASLPEGSMVSFPTNMPMHNFTSSALGRTFDLVYFVARINSDQIGDHPVADNENNDINQALASTLAGIDRVADGITVNDAFSRRQQLSGATVSIRALVVKFIPRIMKTNWIHLRDSSSPRELIATSTDLVEEGDIVVFNGKLRLDRDFGYGYRYEVLLEDASVIR